jgi:hypothetical protein
MQADFATAAAETSSRLFDNRFDPIESGVRSLRTGYERMQEQGAQDLPAPHGRSRQFDRRHLSGRELSCNGVNTVRPSKTWMPGTCAKTRFAL